MKKEFLPALVLSILCMVLFSGVYPLVMLGIARMVPNKGEGFVTEAKGRKYYTNIAQDFPGDEYFHLRPSAVNYNGAGSGGSNKGPINPDYLATVQERIDSFIAHNPTVQKKDIPSEMVTASGSGLDPHISVQTAMIQVNRIATARAVSATRIAALVEQQTEKPLAGLVGPQKVNVLQLNIELDNLK